MVSFNFGLTDEVPYDYPLGINTTHLSASSSANASLEAMFAV